MSNRRQYWAHFLMQSPPSPQPRVASHSQHWQAVAGECLSPPPPSSVQPFAHSDLSLFPRLFFTSTLTFPLPHVPPKYNHKIAFPPTFKTPIIISDHLTNSFNPPISEKRALHNGSPRRLLLLFRLCPIQA
ncbi:hypothetical protein VTI28DRAFT_5222 [Corynascus sepedonium]